MIPSEACAKRHLGVREVLWRDLDRRPVPPSYHTAHQVDQVVSVFKPGSTVPVIVV